MITLIYDIKYGLRMLAKHPGFTIVVTLTLAIAIGATSAIFSVVRTTIIDPLPVPDADRLMYVDRFNTQDGRGTAPVNAMTIHELRRSPEIFASLAVYRQTSRNFRGTDCPDQLSGAEVSPSFFLLWRISPVLGRTFAVDENQPGRERVVILSYALWQGRFGSDPNIIGKTVEFDTGKMESHYYQYTVVGVMPAHFRFPTADVAFWVPGANPDVKPETVRGADYYNWDVAYDIAFRLSPGVLPEHAQAILDTTSARHAQDQPEKNKGWKLRLRPLSERFASEYVRHVLWMLFAVIGLVWLIACANVANLLIARAETRQHEIALRGAMGAGRVRLIRQLLTESLLLAILGGLCGLLITSWGIHTLEAFSGGIRMKPFELNWPAFVSSMTLVLVTGIAFGLAPAWQASKAHLQETLRASSSQATQTHRGRLLVCGLIVGEIALTMVLLSGAGLMVHSVIRLLHVDLGYRPENLIRVCSRMPIDLSLSSKAYLAAAKQYHDTLYERFTALPGVVSIGVLGSSAANALSPPVEVGHLHVNRVVCGIENENPFTVLDAPLIEGRFLERSDRDRDTAVVNQACASALWPGQSALGKRFRGAAGGRYREFEIVGVVGDVRTGGYYEEEVRPTFYRPNKFEFGSLYNFYIRTRIDPASLTRPIQIAVKQADPKADAPSIEIVADEFYRSTEQRRRFTFHLSLFAAVGLVLTVIGLYGLLAYAVTRRTHEIGIRIALGARSGDVLKAVLGQGLKLTCIGVAIGLAGALALTRVISSLLYDVSTTDPLTFVCVSLVLASVALLASYVPARRAAKVDPVAALRYE
jgi:putative ABC transport system permease protein